MEWRQVCRPGQGLPGAANATNISTTPASRKDCLLHTSIHGFIQPHWGTAPCQTAPCQRAPLTFGCPVVPLV